VGNKYMSGSEDLRKTLLTEGGDRELVGSLIPGQKHSRRGARRELKRDRGKMPNKSTKEARVAQILQGPNAVRSIPGWLGGSERSCFWAFY